MWNKRVKAHLILIFSVNTNCESMAYRSFSCVNFTHRGVRKVTIGINLSKETTTTTKSSSVPGASFILAAPSPTHVNTNKFAQVACGLIFCQRHFSSVVTPLAVSPETTGRSFGGDTPGCWKVLRATGRQGSVVTPAVGAHFVRGVRETDPVDWIISS